MGFTLIVNPGSSSKKYTLYKESTPVLTMRFEKRGEDIEVCSEINGSRQKCEGTEVSTFKNALDHFFDTAIEEEFIALRNDISCVGVRVVAPGSYFQQHRLIDEVYMSLLRKKEEAAPLHVPMLLRELVYLRKRLPSALLVSVSDSAFHAGLPSVARTYTIRTEDAQAYDIYRFGYHGISVASVVEKTPSVLGITPSKMIVCHIGSGVSITAVKDGTSIDTTMGYAPGSGLPMGSRAGDLDTDALLELMSTKHMRVFDARMYVHTQGGMHAIAETSDLRNILELRSQGDDTAVLAFETFSYHIRKTIGAYIAVLGGLDALVLTATASERNPQLRTLLLSGLEPLGIMLDQEANDQCISRDGVISSKGRAPVVAVIRTRETEQMFSIVQKYIEAI